MTPGDTVVATRRAIELHPSLAAFTFVVMSVTENSITVTPIAHGRFVLLRVQERHNSGWVSPVLKSFTARKNEFVGMEYSLHPELLGVTV